MSLDPREIPATLPEQITRKELDDIFDYPIISPLNLINPVKSVKILFVDGKTLFLLMGS